MIEFIVWGFIIWCVVRIISFSISMSEMKKTHEKIIDHLDKIIHEVNVEQHGEMNYWFDKDTDQFLGQGLTIEEITAHVKSRFPDHIFILPLKGVLCAPDWTLKDHVTAAERLKHYASKREGNV